MSGMKDLWYCVCDWDPDLLKNAEINYNWFQPWQISIVIFTTAYKSHDHLFYIMLTVRPNVCGKKLNE